MWSQDKYQTFSDLDDSWTRVVDLYWEGVLRNYALEYAISTYSCPKEVEFQFLRESMGSYLHVLPLAINILMVEIGLENLLMASLMYEH